MSKSYFESLLLQVFLTFNKTSSNRCKNKTEFNELYSFILHPLQQDTQCVETAVRPTTACIVEYLDFLPLSAP